MSDKWSPDKKGDRPEVAERFDKRSQALRENLKRRKASVHARKTQNDEKNARSTCSTQEDGA